MVEGVSVRKHLRIMHLADALQHRAGLRHDLRGRLHHDRVIRLSGCEWENGWHGAEGEEGRGLVRWARRVRGERDSNTNEIGDTEF